MALARSPPAQNSRYMMKYFGVLWWCSSRTMFAWFSAWRESSLLTIRIHFIIVMIGWTGLAPWEFEFPVPGSLISTFLVLFMWRVVVVQQPHDVRVVQRLEHPPI